MSGFPPQDAQAGGVKGSHPHGACGLADRGHDALAHFVRRAVREGEGEYRVGMHPSLEQASHPRGQHPRLAAARACDHEQRSIRMLDGRALGVVHRLLARGCDHRGPEVLGVAQAI